LFKYSVVALTGLIFAGSAVLGMLVSKGNTGRSLLVAAIIAAIVAVLGVILWFIYKAVALRRKE